MNKEKEQAIAAVRKLQIKLDIVSRFLTLPEMEMEEFLPILLNCKTILDTIVVNNQPLDSIANADWDDTKSPYQDTVDMISDMKRDLKNQADDHKRKLHNLKINNNAIFKTIVLGTPDDSPIIKPKKAYQEEKEDSNDRIDNHQKQMANFPLLNDVYNVLKDIDDSPSGSIYSEFDEELLREENLPVLDMRDWDKEAILNQVRNDLDSYIRSRKGLNRATLAERLGLSYSMFVSLMNGHITNGFTLTEIKIIGDILGVIYIINNKEISTKPRMSRVPKG